MKMKKEDVVRGLGIGQEANSGTRVLPISSVALLFWNDVKEEGGGEGKREKPKSEKTKRVYGMRCLRWAAAAKSEKGGKYFSRKVNF